MAQYEKTIRTDLDKNLDTYTIGTLVTEDDLSHRINIELYKNNIFVPAVGTVVGIAKKHDGVKIAFTGGIENQKAYIEIPDEALDVVGDVTFLIRLTNGNEKTVIGLCKGYVIDARNPDQLVDDDSTVSVQDLIDNLDALLDAVDEATSVLASAENMENYVAMIEESTTASISHTPGTSSAYFILSGVLYKAISNIANGGTIITNGSGQNCIPTKLGEEIPHFAVDNHRLVISFPSEIFSV